MTETISTKANKWWYALPALVIVALLLVVVFAATVTDRTDGSIALHNDRAQVETDCPDLVNPYWHFVFAPNNDKTDFVTITLNLGSETRNFSGASIIPNGGQKDNVFVRVPAEFEIDDLNKNGSSATYVGVTPKKFNLSHVCPGKKVPPTTTTTTHATSTTTIPETTTTTHQGTTTTVPDSTTTVPDDSTTSTVPGDSSSTVPSTVPGGETPIAPPASPVPASPLLTG